MVKFLPYMLLMLSIEVYGQQGEQLYSQYRDVKGSFFTSEITFRCQGKDYKFRSNILTPGELHVKEGLDWVKINDVKIHDSGISFEELMRVTLPDVSRLRKSHEVEGIDEQNISSMPRLFESEYSHVVGKMQIEIDFLEESYRYTNAHDIKVPLHINENHYVRSQRLTGVEDSARQLGISTYTVEDDFRHSFELITKEAELSVLKNELSRNNFLLRSREELTSGIEKLEEEIDNINSQHERMKEMIESNEAAAYSKLIEYGEMDLYAYILRGTLSQSHYCFSTK